MSGTCRRTCANWVHVVSSALIVPAGMLFDLTLGLATMVTQAATSDAALSPGGVIAGMTAVEVQKTISSRLSLAILAGIPLTLLVLAAAVANVYAAKSTGRWQFVERRWWLLLVPVAIPFLWLLLIVATSVRSL